MQLGGIQKCSLIDYPGKIASVLFTLGCPFRCRFCHNASLVIPEQFKKPPLDLEEVFLFLKKRKNQLDAVVISGGEPTLQKDLGSFLEKIKELGYLTKLDTTGYSFKTLENLMNKNLVDYVAMDIKAPLEKYFLITGKPVDILEIKASISLLIQGKIPYEFRTTLLRSLHPLEDLEKIAQEITGANLYILQRKISKERLDPTLKEEKPYEEKELLPYLPGLLSYVKEVKIR